MRFERCASPTAVAGRALSTNLGCDPGEARLTSGPFGKPKLHRPGLEPPVEFSVSHSDDHCLIAVSRAGQIGVDVERRRPIGDIDRIASMYFTAAEAGTIAGFDEDQKLCAFFACWTSKEAYTKALGTGLLTPLRSFAFPAGTSSATGVTWATIHGREWTLYRFEPWPGYAAAAVVAGRVPASSFHLANRHVDDGR
jgi:4'-phosphopantetheinyl transferase